MKNTTLASAGIRHDWDRDEVLALFEQPFNDLLFTAHQVHRRHFDPNTVQVSTLMSIKTGSCPEDCAYCPQSVRFKTGLENESLAEIERVEESARRARERGATRFCMGAAWRSPKDRDLDTVIEMVRRVRELGMETCLTAGMLTEAQAQRLAENGLDYYNHNIDTSEEYYPEVITTRTFHDRLETLEHVREAGMNVCCGGIIGMGETVEDRAEMLRTLANLPEHPQSVPVNQLIQVPGTPLHGREPVEPFEFVRVIAVARILMPASHVRLAAGRTEMSEEMQALCFFAGVNSIFYGEKLLTTPNPDETGDHQLFDRLGLTPEAAEATDERRQATAEAAGRA